MSHTTSIRLDDETKRLLDEVAKFRERKPHWIMVKALESYLAAELEEMRYFKDSETAVNEAMNDGDGVSFEQFSDWVEQRTSS